MTPAKDDRARLIVTCPVCNRPALHLGRQRGELLYEHRDGAICRHAGPAPAGSA